MRYFTVSIFKNFVSLKVRLSIGNIWKSHCVQAVTKTKALTFQSDTSGVYDSDMTSCWCVHRRETLHEWWARLQRSFFYSFCACFRGRFAIRFLCVNVPYNTVHHQYTTAGISQLWDGWGIPKRKFRGCYWTRLLAFSHVNQSRFGLGTVLKVHTAQWETANASIPYTKSATYLLSTNAMFPDLVQPQC